jgi:cytochrome bd-type quinol oxidase subunit 2
MGEEMLSPSPEWVSSMTDVPVSGQAPFTAGPAHTHSRRARWAVRLAEAAAPMTAIAVAVYGVAFVVGGSSAVEDNWVAILVLVLFFGGLLASVIAFVLAVAMKVKHEQWRLLWLPLSVFPVLLAFVVLGEAFWWE